MPDLGAHEFQPCAVWRAQKYSAGADGFAMAEPLADPDGDGANNLQEFAHEAEPIVSTSWIKPQPGLFIPGDGQAYGQLSFSRCAGTHSLAYVVQASPGLATWTNGWMLTDAGVMPGAVLLDAVTGRRASCEARRPSAPASFPVAAGGAVMLRS